MNDHASAAFGRALIAETERRLFEESVPRIRQCLGQLEEEELWQRPNEHLVSTGDLVLHLCGNVRQWIGTALGGLPDHRDRASEFAEKPGILRAELFRRLEALETETREVLQALDPASLLAPRKVQCFEETGLSILVHVVEHFSYHTGQISYSTKLRKNTDLGYYGDLPLSETANSA